MRAPNSQNEEICLHVISLCFLEHRVIVLQERRASIRVDAATLDAPTISSAPTTLPTEAAMRTAFSEEFTPELVDCAT